MTSEDDLSTSGSLLPEERIGAAMRLAREREGISLRQLSKQLGYHSHTTLSAYERGAVMPTDEAVQGYERVLGLEPATLLDVLESARIERHGDAWPKRRVHLPTEFMQPSFSKDSPDSRSPWRSRVLARWLVAGAGVLVVGVAVVVAVTVLPGQHKPAKASATLIGVRDGADPKVTGCALGATTLDSVDVYDPPQHLVGIFQLRSSARCGTSWGRFVPTVALATKPPLELEIDVYRPADGAMARFRVAYDRNYAYGNMLISKHACVYAQLALIRHGRPVMPPIQTACR